MHGTSYSTTARARRSLLICAAAAIAVLTACGGDSTGPTGSNSPVGAYTMSTVNTKPLPFTMFSDTNFKYEVTAGSISLTSDGKYSLSTTFRQTVVSNVETFVDTLSGTWTQSGGTISFVASDSSTDKATWTDGQLTVTDSVGKGTATFVYKKK